MSIRNEYMKARRSAQSRYRRLMNAGYYFDVNPIPNIPKRITEGSIRKLKKLTTKELRKRSSYFVSFETGEVLTPHEGFVTQKRKREKGEKLKDFLDEAKQREIYDKEQEIQANLETEFISQLERKNAGDSEQILTEDEYDTEIANAYDSGEYEVAKDLERERDEYYSDSDEVAEIDYDTRFFDAVEIIRAYHPEIADRLQSSYDEYVTSGYGESITTSINDDNIKEFEEALSDLEDIKYRGNNAAWWEIYTKLDKTLNKRNHTRAEMRAFFGRLQSGDFNYE